MTPDPTPPDLARLRDLTRECANGRPINGGDLEFLDDLADALSSERTARQEAQREAVNLAGWLHKRFYSEVTQWRPFDDPAGVVTQIDNMVAGVVQRLEVAEARAEAAERERDEAQDDRDDYRERLQDLVMIDSEEWAIGGGPGFKDRKERAWTRAREPFEP